MNMLGGVDFDVSWISDNLLRKDICLSSIDFSGDSNNLWNSLLDLLRDRISSEPPRITVNAVSEDASEVHVLRLLKLKIAESIHLNNVDRHLYSRVIQEWEKDVDSVKAKCIWSSKREVFPDDFANGFEKLKDAPPLFKRHAREIAGKASHMDFTKGNHYVKEHPTERGRKLYLWWNTVPEGFWCTNVILCF